MRLGAEGAWSTVGKVKLRMGKGACSQYCWVGTWRLKLLPTSPCSKELFGELVVLPAEVGVAYCEVACVAYPDEGTSYLAEKEFIRG